MKKRSLLTGLFLIILSSITIITRIYYVNCLMSEVNINEDIYNAAKVSVDSSGLASAFANGFRMQSLYICNLYLVFLVFGNFTVAGVYLNILYQFLTILLIYIALRSMTDRYVGNVGSLILAILPPYIRTLSEVTMQNMLICIIVLFSTIIILIIRWIYHKYTTKRDKIYCKKQGQLLTIGCTAQRSRLLSEVKGTSDKLYYQKTAYTEDKKKEDGELAHMSIESIMDTSMKEIRYDDLEDKKIQYIENPLPVPKRKEHKEMEYAFIPTDSDDYDMKDLTGKDFYDIE